MSMGRVSSDGSAFVRLYGRAVVRKPPVDLVLEREMSVPLMAGTYMVLTSILVVYGVINYGIEAVSYRRRLPEGLAPAPVLGSEEGNADGMLSEISEDEIKSMSQRQGYRLSTFQELARRVAGILAFLVRAKDPETGRQIAQYVEWRIDGASVHLRAFDRANPSLIMSDIRFTR